MTQPGKRFTAEEGIELRFATLEADALTPGQRGGARQKEDMARRHVPAYRQIPELHPPPLPLS